MISKLVLNFNMVVVRTCNIIFKLQNNYNAFCRHSTKLHSNKQELDKWTILCYILSFGIIRHSNV